MGWSSKGRRTGADLTIRFMNPTVSSALLNISRRLQRSKGKPFFSKIKGEASRQDMIQRMSISDTDTLPLEDNDCVIKKEDIRLVK